jgi:hypothetical protein
VIEMQFLKEEILMTLFCLFLKKKKKKKGQAVVYA